MRGRDDISLAVAGLHGETKECLKLINGPKENENMGITFYSEINS